ncbi:hypothetical protein GCM10028857_17260 [Salinarchaeum chitinilyticum]
MTDVERPTGPLDVATLTVLARRAVSHPLVDRWTLQPGAMSPRRLELELDAEQYPSSIDTARLDVRWFEGGDYALHYLETEEDGDDDEAEHGTGNGGWQCRWDRHPKPDEPRSHFHPPPDASAEVVESGIDADHHLDVLFAVLDRIEQRVESLHAD